MSAQGQQGPCSQRLCVSKEVVLWFKWPPHCMSYLVVSARHARAPTFAPFTRQLERCPASIGCCPDGKACYQRGSLHSTDREIAWLPARSLCLTLQARPVTPAEDVINRTLPTGN